MEKKVYCFKCENRKPLGVVKEACSESDFSLLVCVGCGIMFMHQEKGWFGKKENIRVWSNYTARRDNGPIIKF